MENKYFNLLKSYCDRLIENQITTIKNPAFYGAMLCPACAAIHGRMADSVYPLTAMYAMTGESKYINAACKAVDWAEYNVARENGSYYNDKCSQWTGISVFSLMSYGEAIHNYGHVLDYEVKEKFLKIFNKLASFVYTMFENPNFNPNINYHVTYCPAMAITYLITGEEKYKEAAYKKAEFLKNHFTDEGLLYGESKPVDFISPRGFRGVDLGYNVEESLPALTMFANFMKDEEYLKFCEEKYMAHLEFMLPDGGWDNSWGTRANKWTYWGSRTSDGAQTGLAILAKRNPIFAEAAERNFRIYEKCSKDGYLYGGYMYKEAGEEPCLHHSFCHAKSLCAMIENKFEHKENCLLPRDKEYGIKNFDSVGLKLIAKGDFRATISYTDAIMYSGAATSGGTLNILYNMKRGPVFAAAMANYNATEPRNMQLSRHHDRMLNNALRINHNGFENVNAKDAEVICETEGNEIKVTVNGTLANISYAKDCKYRIIYTFGTDYIKIKAFSEEGGRLILPLISTHTEETEISSNTVKLLGKCPLTLESEKEIRLDIDKNEREFNVVGGFETLPVYVMLEKGKETEIKVTI